MNHSPFRSPAMQALAWATAAVAALACGLPAAQAQGVYRSVGPDGKVTFSDRAPVAEAKPLLRDNAAPAATAAPAGLAALPYGLRQTAQRFPFTLYTSAECAPCAGARNMLLARGVPFSERTVRNNEDIEALQRLSGSTTLPFATIGSQQLSGFSDLEWKQYLDAAGYPKESQLPSNYQRPAATPLVAVQRAENSPAAAAAAATPASRQRPGAASPATQPSATDLGPGTSPSNPAGIRF